MPATGAVLILLGLWIVLRTIAGRPQGLADQLLSLGSR